MKIGFGINNISDPPNGLPSVSRFAQMQILPSDLELPLDEFIARFIRPTVEQCRDEFIEMIKCATDADNVPSTPEGCDGPGCVCHLGEDLGEEYLN